MYLFTKCDITTLIYLNNRPTMLCITYISAASKLADADLNLLVKDARKKNAQLEITGILLYRSGDIMQLLEGPDECVRELVRTIYADRRHHHVRQLLARDITVRTFPGCQLQFQNLKHLNMRDCGTPLNEELWRHDDTRSNPMLILLTGFGYRAD
jgi:hypothetical protein